MVFSSLLFLFRFLPLVLLLDRTAPKPLKNSVLFLSSLFFYAWGEPVYVVLMLFSTTVDYVHGRIVQNSLNEGKRRKAQAALTVSVVINLSLLGVFKYSPLDLPLPVGISFYTFQTMSYTIDIYRGKAKAQKNILDFGTYVALFPQLIAGPIVRYSTIVEELTDRTVTAKGFADGILRFMAGLGKKVLLANNIGYLWTVISRQGMELPALTAWLGILAFSFQIYFDFSGYSDMAIGLGKMLGFTFPENFNYPYVSKSITEFWRRWHISLGTWFKEYVYIPLGGNRRGKKIQLRNMMIVWLLTGIWHGAGWNFALWGMYFGILLALEKFLLAGALKKAPGWISHLYTMLLVIIGWVLFSFDSVENAEAYLASMSGRNGLADEESIFYLCNYGILFLILAVASTPLPKMAVNRWKEKCLDSRWRMKLPVLGEMLFIAAVFLFSIAFLVEATYNPFLYFRF